jgi:hypothetical protein
MGYLTINTQSNGVDIFDSVECWTVTFQPISRKTLVFIYVVHSANVPVISCSNYYCCSIYFVVVRLSFNSFVWFFCFSLFIVHCSKKTIQFWSWIVVQVFWSIVREVPVHHHLCKSNKHHTSDRLHHLCLSIVASDLLQS